jgi:uncharacterized protein (TIGR02001 family)
VDLDYQEIYGSFSFYGATLGLVYSDDYFQSTEDFFYFYGDYSFPLGEVASLDLHLGFNDTDAAFGADGSYVDYSIAVAASAVGLDFTLAWVGTDISKSECFGGSKVCESNAVLTVAKSL